MYYLLCITERVLKRKKSSKVVRIPQTDKVVGFITYPQIGRVTVFRNRRGKLYHYSALQRYDSKSAVREDVPADMLSKIESIYSGIDLEPLVHMVDKLAEKCILGERSVQRMSNMLSSTLEENKKLRETLLNVVRGFDSLPESFI